MGVRFWLAALAVAVTAGGLEGGTVDLGTFVNVGDQDVSYEGGFGAYVTWEALAGGHLRIDVDLGGLLGSLDVGTFSAVIVSDTGRNSYGPMSSGADMDLFTLEGLDVGVSYLYAGPTPTHQDETSDILGQRLAKIDAMSGVHEDQGLLHVSLGFEGSITAQFSAPQGIDFEPGGGGGGGGGPAGAPLVLHLAEAGASESFRVSIETSPPAPACPADTNDDGHVDVSDLVIVITAWGGTQPGADVNDDGVVGVADVVAVLLAWGPC
jgi:hypothetical protein